MITNDLRMKKSGIDWNNFCIYFSSSTWVGKSIEEGKQQKKTTTTIDGFPIHFLSWMSFSCHLLVPTGKSLFRLASRDKCVSVHSSICSVDMFLWCLRSGPVERKIAFQWAAKKRVKGKNWEMRNVHPKCCVLRPLFIQRWNVTSSLSKARKKLAIKESSKLFPQLSLRKWTRVIYREAFRNKCSRLFYDVTVKTKSSSWVSAQAYQNKSNRGMVRVLLLDAWTDLSTQD